MRPRRELYEAPRHVSATEECTFYHSMSLPGLGEVDGVWDLRAGVDEYLGRIELSGHRVLEIGPASGYLTFHMEAAGAEVVSVEIPSEQPGDLLPAAGIDMRAAHDARREDLQRQTNAYWRAHEAHGSRARVYRGSAYDLPDALGTFDVAVLACVLLHMRDPAQALCECARLTTGSIVVTEPIWLPELPTGAAIELMAVSQDAWNTWWQLTPAFVEKLLVAVGFCRTTVTFHEQHYVTADGMVPMFTVVASR